MVKAEIDWKAKYEALNAEIERIDRMPIFKQLADRDIKCEICGANTISLYGGGWDNDRIYCSDRECDAEYVFPTTTEVKNDPIPTSKSGRA